MCIAPLGHNFRGAEVNQYKT